MKLKRIESVEAYIHAKKTVSLDELAEHFEVSKNTIRRDIDKIVLGGNVEKVYGGVTSLYSQLQPYEQRDTTSGKQKELIGKKAASLIENNDVIFIDSGTTTRYIAENLNPDMTLTIITNNLDAINLIADNTNYHIIMIGNTYKHATRSFVNVEDWDFFDRINITKTFMGATGLSIERGVTNSDILEYEIKSRIVKKTDANYLLVDENKFDHSTLITYAPISSFKVIITSNKPSQKYQDFCNEERVELIYTS